VAPALQSFAPLTNQRKAHIIVFPHRIVPGTNLSSGGSS
jgi:hypothetical protein